jgi:hypothetical protein
VSSAAWRKSYVGHSASEWLPAPEPERPRGADAHRSPEATARRRARKAARRDATGGSQSEPPAEPPSSRPDFNVRTVDGCSWDALGRPRWHLPTHSGRPALDPDMDVQKMLIGQRERWAAMRQGDGEGSN